VAEQNIRLDSFASAFRVNRYSERLKDRARQLNTHNLPVV
jgi:hypothetical protein